MTLIILGIFIISFIGAILALLLEVADSYIADYGEMHILVNEKKDLLVKGGSPLLSTLMEQGIFIPSACGGKGTCAYCKVKVIEGGGPVLPTERPYLNPEELERHVRLSCQVKVKENIRIEIPEDLFLVKEFKIKVNDIRDLTPQIKGLTFEILSPGEGITFKPGQYVQLEVPKYKMTSGPEYRAYSIASGSDRRHEVDLIITRAPDGAVSTYVHDYMKAGDELIMTGPFGDFYLREGDRDILLIATGSGLAPIRSILFQIERENIQRPVTLFFGARTRKDLYYYDELRSLEERLPHLTYIPALSRPAEGDRWEGEKGRVTNLIEKHVPENAGIDVYICGSPVMVESCLELLEKKGMPQDRIFFDKFE